jgi:hypothetical protein
MNNTNKPHPALTDKEWQNALNTAVKIGVRPETLLPFFAGYIAPGPTDVINLKAWCGLSSREISKLLGVGDKMPRHWMNTKNAEQYRAIVPAYWRYWLACYGLIDIDVLQPKKT